MYMIISYIKNKKGDKLEKFQELKNNAWISVEKPAEDEITQLVEQLDLDRDLLHDALDLQEVPRFEIENKTSYIFTKFVYADTNGQIKTAPILLIRKPGYFITVSSVPFQRLSLFTDEKIDFITSDRTDLFVKMLNQINETYNVHINIISKKVQRLSVNIEKVKNRDIIQFVNYENILYDIKSALVRINAIFHQLSSGRKIRFDESEKEYLEDLNLDNDQYLHITEESLRSITNIREAYSTIMTNNLNRVIKLFTSLTVIMTIPTMVGTFYGMNVPIPMQQYGNMFTYIVLGSLLASFIALLIFLYKDWL